MFSKRATSAIFLCLIVLLDEFCVKSEYASSIRRISYEHIQSPVTFVDNSENDIDDFYQSNTTSDVSTRKEKRGVILAILVGASIVASLANLGFDIYLHIKGCCGVYPSACRYRDEFNRLKKTLTSKSRSIDNIWTSGYLPNPFLNLSSNSAENTKEWVKQCNYQNRELWLEMNRIADVEDELIEALSTDLIIAFNNKSGELKGRIRRKNATVLEMSLSELGLEYESAFSSAKSTLLAISGVVGNVGSLLISRAMKSYKINKMTNFLKTSEGSRLVNAQPKAQKLLGVSKTNVNQHFRATAKAQYKANYKPIRGKIATGAAAVLAIITIGLEIYSAVMKVKACQNVRDNAHDAAKNMRKANSDMDKTLRDVREYNRRVTVNGWNKIRKELLKEDLRNILSEFRSLALGAAKQSKAMKDAVAAIDTFQRNIRSGAKYKTTYDLQNKLVKGLAGLKFSLECYRNLVKATTFIFDHCAKGDGRFSELWDRATFNFKLNSKSCHDDSGVPYTSQEKMKSTLKVQASKKKFNPDCILNSENIKYLTCSKKYQGYNAKEIAKLLKLTEAQVNTILPNCPPAPITPRTINMICLLHKNKVSMDTIISITKVNFRQVASIILTKCAHTATAKP